MIINRHGDFDPVETARLLRSNGLFITEQVGGENDRDLVKIRQAALTMIRSLSSI